MAWFESEGKVCLDPTSNEIRAEMNPTLQTALFPGQL